MYTDTQQRIINLLSDGKKHKKAEVLSCLLDKQASYSCLANHLCHLRKLLRPRGEDIICELSGYNIFYRHVRLLKSPYDE